MLYACDKQVLVEVFMHVAAFVPLVAHIRQAYSQYITYYFMLFHVTQVTIENSVLENVYVFDPNTQIAYLKMSCFV